MHICMSSIFALFMLKNYILDDDDNPKKKQSNLLFSQKCVYILNKV